MLGTISTMQVASMLPLSSITVPSNAMSFYKILITFVAFDFLPAIDIGFTFQKPYNEKFKQAGFTTINLITNLGTFLCLVLAMLTTLTIVAIIINLFASKAFKAREMIHRYFMPSTAMQAWTKALFIMYIALSFSCLIAFKMYGIRDFWTGSDKFAVTVHIFATLLLVLFPIFVAWFVIYKSRAYINLKHE